MTTRSRALLVTMLAVTRVHMWWRGACLWGCATKGLWHQVQGRDIVGPVDRFGTTDRLLLIPAAQLDDLLELARLAAARLPEYDALQLALIGAIAEVRISSAYEP